ncbi:hypothetical protein [Bradyrhizobium sp.]|uniref:hypothetical protein n=1 Tax=Bradyrhizobium sp. TaxID=376 RepID=UPI004037A781
MTANRSEFIDALLKEGAPIFAASGDTGGSRLTLHVAAESDVEQLRAGIRSALSETSAKLRVSVRTHRLYRLAFPRSLEHWLRPFSDGILYDPTMIVARARELLSSAQSCRTALGRAVDGIFCDPASRSILVLARGGNLADLQSRIASAVAVTGGWEGSIRVVSVLPRQTLVPVDAKTAGYLARLSRFIRRWRTPGAVALAISAASAIPASAHTGGARLDMERTTLSMNATAESEFGVLSRLSVFADGARPGEADAFVTIGLQMYFGDKVLIAQRRKQTRCEYGRLPNGRCAEEEVGQTGPGAAGPGGTGGPGGGGAGPGS